MDKRYKFIRSKNSFENLDDYFFTPYFRPKEKFLDYAFQGNLFEVEKTGKGEELRTKEGKFFENIATKMYGGIKKLTYVKDFKDNGDLISIEPDISNTKKGILHEVKGIQKSSHVKLSDNQIAKYVLLQSKEYFPKPPRIRYEIFGHGINELQNEFNNKSLESMINELTSSIRYFISLPFSVVFEFYSQDNKNVFGKQFTSRHDNEKTYDTLTRLNASALNSLIAYPKETLKELDLNPERFQIEKKRFPRTFKINGKNINPFPMLFVYDKEYSKFIDELPDKINCNEVLQKRISENTKLLKNKEDFNSEIPEWLTPEDFKECPF